MQFCKVREQRTKSYFALESWKCYKKYKRNV